MTVNLGTWHGPVCSTPPPITKLQAIRMERGLSQTQMAALLEVRQNNLHRWEKGEIEPKVSAAIQIAQKLGLSVEEVF